jgi:hypothetical protein
MSLSFFVFLVLLFRLRLEDPGHSGIGIGLPRLLFGGFLLFVEVIDPLGESLGAACGSQAAL